MKNHRVPQEVNAGSMADIAFLLLIFFLVTTSIENDAGLNRLMPPDNNEAIADIKERNLFEISINDTDQIMANGDIIELSSLRKNVIAFIDNGGLLVQSEEYCDYCKGERLADLSEHPSKAIVSIKSQNNTSYPVYVAVQNEVIGAYNALRNRESLRLFNTTYEAINYDYYNDGITNTQKEKLKERLEIIRVLYPQKILEPQTVNN
ncbi:ExbD/TolR family protein [Maribacter arcticus]|uniref:Biopolymer transport protein ExbD/TolR n=1 Tax=Maribacter arcticus TaxID=561365 RepID=A0A1T5B113_9FLAO|nr:biopolymer transporter ExbD [Maribacter arcticus]SKB40670.1 Biopolymer transport protein ExbD/TolR [Maribacter arcticus]